LGLPAIKMPRRVGLERYGSRRGAGCRSPGNAQ
jgi:hypothetical protein